MSAPSVPEGDELQYYKAQNTQLWKVITKQKSVIHKLQKETTRLLAERDDIIQKLEARGSQHKQEEPPRPLVQSPELLPVTINASSNPSGHPGEPSAAVQNESPVPPPRSPYRQNSAKDMPTKDVPRNEPPIPKPTITNEVRVEERKPVPEPIILSNSPPSPVPDVLSPRKAIIDKDAQLFAEFNASLMKRERQKPTNAALVNATFPRDYQKEAEQVRQEALKKTGTITDDDYEQHSMATSTSTNGHPPTESPTPQATSFETSVNSYSLPESSSNSKQPEPSSFDPSGMSNETLASLSIKVVASKIKANEKDREVLCFIISVGRMLKPPSTDSDCSDLQFEELWRVEKLYSDFINLDAKASHINIDSEAPMVIVNGQASYGLIFLTTFRCGLEF
jgi:RalA-binding protein 1